MNLYKCKQWTRIGRIGEGKGYDISSVSVFSIGKDGEKMVVAKKYITPYFAEVPAAQELYGKHRSLNTLDFLTTSVGWLGAGYIAASSLIDGMEPPIKDNVAANIGLSFLALGATGVITYYAFEKYSDKRLEEAVKAYNKGLSKKTSFLTPLKPDYLKIGNAQGTAGISIGWHLGRN